ncbi:methyltransferase-like protein 2 isoform X2 [Limulus polyphemus]|nr:methyltransferase-like protein 2 isoform X2 [Limulus polyphemus]
MFKFRCNTFSFTLFEKFTNELVLLAIDWYMINRTLSYMKRSTGAKRKLQDLSHVFKYNAWDDIKWSSEQEAAAREKVANNSKVKVSASLQEKYENEASDFWNKFYEIHQNRFFKNRRWLFTEFPELALENTILSEKTNAHSKIRETSNVESRICRPLVIRGGKEKLEAVIGQNLESEKYCSSEKVDEMNRPFPGAEVSTRILEVGCGAGNTVFPILELNNSQDLFVYCCDFSDVAVSLVKSNEKYDPAKCYAFSCDVTAHTWLVPFPECSLDVVLLIFVLSAIHPEK